MKVFFIFLTALFSAVTLYEQLRYSIIGAVIFGILFIAETVAEIVREKKIDTTKELEERVINYITENRKLQENELSAIKSDLQNIKAKLTMSVR